MNDLRVRRIVLMVVSGAAVAATALMVLGPSPSPKQWMAVAFFASFGTLASVLGYRTAGGASGTIAFLPFLSVALISPNWAACVAVLVSALTAEVLVKRARGLVAVFLGQLVFGGNRQRPIV